MLVLHSHFLQPTPSNGLPKNSSLQLSHLKYNIALNIKKYFNYKKFYFRPVYPSGHSVQIVSPS